MNNEDEKRTLRAIIKILALVMAGESLLILLLSIVVTFQSHCY